MLILDIWKDFKVLSPIILNPSYPPTSLADGLYGHKPLSFPPNRLQKCGRVNKCFLKDAVREKSIWRIPTSLNLNQISAALCWIFSSIKSVPASRKKGFYANCVLKKQEVGGIFVWSGSELWSLFKYSTLKLKTYSGCGWCPYQGLSNGTSLMQVYSGRTVPFLVPFQLASLWYKH